MKTVTKTALTLSAATLLSAAMASEAAITVVNSDSVADVTSTALGSQTHSLDGFDAAGVEKLIVTVVGEGKVAGTLLDPTVTFGSKTFTLAASENDLSTPANGQQYAGVFYLDLPDQIVGDILIDWDGTAATNGAGISVVGLTGAAGGGPVSTGTSTSAGGPLSLSPDPSAGDFAIVTFVTNGAGGSIDITSGTVTDLYSSDVGSADGAAAYEFLGAGGPLNYSYTGGSSGRPAGAAAVFTEGVIPEPSSLALLGLGGLLIARRRRAS
ncbi:MAG: PEP-CTERM sorting domain-containing protein [Planctomycetota bacterium]